MSWFPYNSIRKALRIIGRWRPSVYTIASTLDIDTTTIQYTCGVRPNQPHPHNILLEYLHEPVPFQRRIPE
jgi:hypothetical protein